MFPRAKALLPRELNRGVLAPTYARACRASSYCDKCKRSKIFPEKMLCENPSSFEKSYLILSSKRYGVNESGAEVSRSQA